MNLESIFYVYRVRPLELLNQFLRPHLNILQSSDFRNGITTYSVIIFVGATNIQLLGSRIVNFPIKWLVKRKAIEVRILTGCFVARNKGGVLPFKLRTNGDLLVHLRIYIFSWLYNMERLREILQKRQNRTMKFVVTK